MSRVGSQGLGLIVWVRVKGRRLRLRTVVRIRIKVGVKVRVRVKGHQINYFALHPKVQSSKRFLPDRIISSFHGRSLIPTKRMTS